MLGHESTGGSLLGKWGRNRPSPLQRHQHVQYVAHSHPSRPHVFSASTSSCAVHGGFRTQVEVEDMVGSRRFWNIHVPAMDLQYCLHCRESFRFVLSRSFRAVPHRKHRSYHRSAALCPQDTQGHRSVNVEFAAEGVALRACFFTLLFCGNLTLEMSCFMSWPSSGVRGSRAFQSTTWDFDSAECFLGSPCVEDLSTQARE